MCVSPNESTDVLAVLETEFAELETEYNSSLDQSMSVESSVNSPALEVTSSDTEARSSTLFVSTSCEQGGGEDILCEPTACDAQEEREVEQFLSDTCKCSLSPEGRPCCLSLSTETIHRSRDKCTELSHNELDLVVMAQIHSFRTTTHQSNPQKTSPTFRPISSYFIHKS